MNQCTVENGVIKMCSSLDKAVEHDYLDRRQGISLLAARKETTGELSRTAVVLRSGEFKKEGLVVNYCPFCGESIAHQWESGREGGAA